MRNPNFISVAPSPDTRLNEGPDIAAGKLRTADFLSPIEKALRGRVQSAEVSKGEAPQGVNSTLVVHRRSNEGMTPRDLAEMAVPLTSFIGQTQPDIVIGNDRGGRLYSLAAYSLWSNQHPHDHFPTIDRKLHFARFSKSLASTQIDESMEMVLKRSLSTSRLSDTGKSQISRMLVIDDWVLSGATKKLVANSLERLGLADEVELNFAVMRGGGANVSGGSIRKAVPWHDRPELIGVDYSHGEIVARPLRTDRAHELRQSIHQETKAVAQRLTMRERTLRGIAAASMLGINLATQLSR